MALNGVKILGFVVSDGHKSKDDYMGIPVYEFSSISKSAEDICIIQAALSEPVSIKLVASGCKYLILPEKSWEAIEFGMNDNK